MLGNLHAEGLPVRCRVIVDDVAVLGTRGVRLGNLVREGLLLQVTTVAVCKVGELVVKRTERVGARCVLHRQARLRLSTLGGTDGRASCDGREREVPLVIVRNRTTRKHLGTGKRDGARRIIRVGKGCGIEKGFATLVGGSGGEHAGIRVVANIDSHRHVARPFTLGVAVLGDVVLLDGIGERRGRIGFLAVNRLLDVGKLEREVLEREAAVGGRGRRRVGLRG